MEVMCSCIFTSTDGASHPLCLERTRFSNLTDRYLVVRFLLALRNFRVWTAGSHIIAGNHFCCEQFFLPGTGRKPDDPAAGIHPEDDRLFISVAPMPSSYLMIFLQFLFWQLKMSCPPAGRRNQVPLPNVIRKFPASGGTCSTAPSPRAV